MYEPHTKPLLSRRAFAKRLLAHGGVAALMVGGILFAPVLHRLLHRLHIDQNRS